MSSYPVYCKGAEDPRNCQVPHQHPHSQPHHSHPNAPSPCCGGGHGHSYYSPYGYAAHDCRRRRTTYTNQQLNILEDEYANDPYMETIKRQELARRLDLSEPQIKVWFQNRRAKDKREGRGTGNDDDYSPILKTRHNPHRNRLVPKSKDSTPRESNSPQENHQPSLKGALDVPIKHSPNYKPNFPPMPQYPHNGIPNNFAEYMATPVAMAMHSGKMEPGSFHQPPYGSMFNTLSAYNVDELGALCAEWKQENNPSEEKVITAL